MDGYTLGRLSQKMVKRDNLHGEAQNVMNLRGETIGRCVGSEILSYLEKMFNVDTRVVL
jgi:hypothetical protein